MKIRFAGGLLAMAMLTSACGEDPFVVRWESEPLEATLYALDREFEHVLRPTAFHMIERRGFPVEDPRVQGRWDFALERNAGGLALLPPQLLGVVSRAAIVPIPGVGFEDLLLAPADTLLYVTNEPVPVELGTTYVIRTHQQSGFFGGVCVFYGKVEPLELDVVAGVLRFLHDVNPDCNNRSLTPPD